jgi:hypothetical protein
MSTSEATGVLFEKGWSKEKYQTALEVLRHEYGKRKTSPFSGKSLLECWFESLAEQRITELGLN